MGREILLVDDDYDEHYLFKKSMESVDDSIHIRSFYSGRELLDYLNGDADGEYRRQIILLDLNMPQLDGHEVLQLIRENKGLACMPVIIFSNSQAPEDIEKSYRYGANAHLTKATNEKDSVRDMTCLVEFWFERACLVKRGKENV